MGIRSIPFRNRVYGQAFFLGRAFFCGLGSIPRPVRIRLLVLTMRLRLGFSSFFFCAHACLVFRIFIDEVLFV